MAGTAKVVKDTKTVETTEEKVEEKKEEVYHVRLHKASMYIEPLLGLELNALQNKRTGTVSKDLPDNILVKLRQAISFQRVEIYNPNLPEMTEPPKKKKKDLANTNEARVLAHPDEAEIISYIEMVSGKGTRGTLSLKIMYLLETEDQKRANIVDLLSAKLKDQGITRPSLSEMEIDGIVVLNTEPGEIITAV